MKQKYVLRGSKLFRFSLLLLLLSVFLGYYTTPDTDAQTSNPSFSISPTQTSYQIGNTITVVFNNMPSGWQAKIAINTGASQSCSSTNCPITLSTANGATDNSINIISVVALDGSGNIITSFPYNSQTINIGTVNSGSPTFSISPSQTSYQMGSTINVAFTNMPSGWQAKIAINTGASQSCSSPVCSITLAPANGATDNSANTISVVALDGSGNIITSFPYNSQTINIGTVSTSPNQAAPGSPSPTAPVNLYNPLPENDLTHVFLLVTKSFLDIMGIWAVMFIIFGGFQMVLSSGNEEAYAKAKKTITWAVLGLAVALLSFSIVAIVEDLLQANIQPPTTTGQSAPPTTQ